MKESEEFSFTSSTRTVNDNFVCQKCKEISLNEYSLEEFLQNFPIPDNCENDSGCRCYLSINYTDIEGDLEKALDDIIFDN